jgi:hypothetical protein
MMRVGDFVWPDEPISVCAGVVRPYTPDIGPAIVCDPLPRAVPAPQPEVKRGRPEGVRHAYNIHNEPAIVNRLIRMIEELLERDDEIQSSDLQWYRNRLDEIKRELANAEEGGKEAVRPTGEGAAWEASPGIRTANGGLLQGD